MLRSSKLKPCSALKKLILKSAFFGLLSASLVTFCLDTTVAQAQSQEAKTATERLQLAKKEFYQKKAKNPVFRRELFDINYNIRYHEFFANNRRTLSVDEAWKGVEEKAWNPVKYIPHAIKKGMVLKDTILEDNNASFFVRISIQEPFIENIEPNKKEFTVVREEISIDKINKIVYFMGRIPEPSDYQLLSVDPKQAKPQVIFLDEHKVASVDGDPLDSWTLVTLPTKGFTMKDQEFFVKNLASNPGRPERIYKKTQELF